eukprot:441084_1
MSEDEIIAALEASEASEHILEIFAFITSLIFLMIYIYYFYRLRQYELSMNASKRKRNTTNIWIMVLPTMYTLCYTLRYLLKVISTATDHKDIPLRVTFDACFVIGHALFYVIMLLRLALGFRGTQYALSRVKLIACVILLSGISLINIFYYLIKRNGVGDDTIIDDPSLSSFNQWNEEEVHDHLFIALVFSNLFFAAILIYLFVRNIVLMVLYQMELNENNLSERYVKWLSIAVKYALLCGIAIFCTNIQFSLWILFNFGVFEGNPVGGITFAACNDWFWIVVLVNNYVCILLTFPGEARLIYDTMCVSCHVYCQSMVKQGILKHLKRKNQKKIEVNPASPTKEKKRTNVIQQFPATQDGVMDGQVKSEQDIEKQNTNAVVIGMSMAELQNECGSVN